jgi:hypothetical protein
MIIEVYSKEGLFKSIKISLSGRGVETFDIWVQTSKGLAFPERKRSRRSGLVAATGEGSQVKASTLNMILT